MRIRVLYFAFIKDITKRDTEEIETTCTTVDCLIDELSRKYGQLFTTFVKEGRGPMKVTVLVNGEKKHELNPEAEVAIFPPPSGGDLVFGDIDVISEIRKFREKAPPEAGSLVVYVGFVKGYVEGHRVTSLKYETYREYTEKRIGEIQQELLGKYKDLVDIKIIHSIGDKDPGEDVMLIMALGRGRKDSIQAIEEAVELVKHTTGIWKLEIREDGQFWVVAGNTRVRRE